MGNWDTQETRAYHQDTKLSYVNLSLKPPLYKSYPGFPVTPLPSGFPLPHAGALEVMSLPSGGPAATPDLTALARLLFLSAGVVRKAQVPHAGEVHYRAAASAGALYPIEVYVVCRDLPGLEAGVYHFAPYDFALRRLRRGDWRGELTDAAGGSRQISSAPATFIFTTMFQRSTWKYRARGYRYCLWDNGTVAANLLAATSAEGMPAALVNAFVDHRVDRLVGVDGRREASLCLAPIGHDEDMAPTEGTASQSLPDLATPNPEEASAPVVEFPEIVRMHAATVLATADEVRAAQGAPESPRPLAPRGPLYSLLSDSANSGAGASLGDVIKGRGSTRRFDPSPISYEQFSAMVHGCARPVPADFLADPGASLLDLYVIVNAVTGLPSGAYSVSREGKALELLRQGDFRQEAGHLCFEQALGADASAVAFFLADLEQLLARYGNRGYRAAQLEAGVRGGRIYLCAHALGMGATGITFYDDEVTDFFSPHASGKSAIFVVPFGIPGRPNRVKPFRSAVGVRLDALARGAASQPRQ